MANEWVPVELYGPNGDGQKVRYTISNTDAVSIGTALQILDLRTASSYAFFNKPLAGIAAEEHLPNKGITEISVWTQGRFEATVSGAGSTVITPGDPIMIAGIDNTIASASGSIVHPASFARIIGRALQSGAADLVI